MRPDDGNRLADMSFESEFHVTDAALVDAHRMDAASDEHRKTVSSGALLRPTSERCLDRSSEHCKPEHDEPVPAVNGYL